VTTGINKKRIRKRIHKTVDLTRSGVFVYIEAYELAPAGGLEVSTVLEAAQTDCKEALIVSGIAKRKEGA